jgi:hypothetical protein
MIESEINRDITYIGIINGTVVIKNKFDEVIFIQSKDIDCVVKSLLSAKNVFDREETKRIINDNIDYTEPFNFIWDKNNFLYQPNDEYTCKVSNVKGGFVAVSYPTQSAKSNIDKGQWQKLHTFSGTDPEGNTEYRCAQCCGLIKFCVCDEPL